MRPAIARMVLWVGLIVLYSGKLSAQERWVYRYNGPGNHDDAAWAILAGRDGNIYAGGDSEGSGTSHDFTVISLDTSGTERWVYRYNGLGNNDDRARWIVMGADGNLYAAGYSQGNLVYSDFTVIALDTAGGERWVYRYDGPGNDNDAAHAIVAGTGPNLYAAGWSCGPGTDSDFTVISLDTSGTERWVYRYNGPGNDLDMAYAVVMGANDNVYAAGLSCGNGTDFDFTVISLTSSGGERWVYRYDGPGNRVDGAYAIVMGADGNLYAAGYSTDSTGSGSGPDFIVISLDTSGTERWVYRYNGPGNGVDLSYSIVMGADGNLYAAGCSWGNGIGDDITVVSLDTSGTELWVYRYNGPGNGDDRAYSIVMGADGNLYAAGCSWGNGASEDLTVVSLTPSGIERWVYTYNGPGDGPGQAQFIVTGTDGNIYTAGRSHGSGTSSDFTVISLSSDAGAVEAEPRAPQSPILQISAFPIPAVSAVKICYSVAQPTEVKLAIYEPSGRLVNTLVSSRRESGSTIVIWDCKAGNGKRMSAGTYFCRLTADEFTQSRKLALLK